MTAAIERPGGARQGNAVARLWRESTLVRHLVWSLLGLLGYYVLSVSLDAFANLQLAQIAYLAIATAGLTVLSGLSGQISLGHGAFVAVGAYTSALLLQHQQWPTAVVLVAAVVVTAALGALVGVAAARLRGPYLAGATLALAVGLPALADYHGLRAVLGGANGLIVTSPPPPAALGESFPVERWQSWIAGLCLVVTLFLLANLIRSPLGRAMRYVREDEDAAALSGVSVARTQILAFSVSAGCAGLAGGLFALVNNLAAPGAFTLTLSLSLLTAAVLGGLGSLAGAVYGAVIVTLLPNWSTELAQAANLPREIYANVPLVLYGVVLMVVIVLFPGGIQSGVRRVGRLLRTAVRR
ncbi:branched-chain amino acid ABC transporter permease [Amycolatopsis cynarae]|uniref:Branched-chain amino acid ABC transporter permease n=1 Tax=Amycolatopsis cynarae TaxID=2995223 RepID=A0ABY7B9Z8_9PSEU|nr:branched-chain amino acid ABC transporter permease [Amycolatopsis sp. HUAS 11-8]WAL69197.1 branched-chain amino acid ABC transporter permease [Amycolatopsis sp. HUAS 11-8]